MRKQVAHFAIGFIRFLNSDGTMEKDFPEKLKDPQWLKERYSEMLFTRKFDAKSINLQRTGRMSTYGSCEGQEAQVGIASAMTRDDVLVPSYREMPIQLCRGVTPCQFMLFWGGDERGNVIGDSRFEHDFPICVPVGSQAIHAVGVANAIKIRGENRAVVCVFGDGGSSKGDAYEALNFAGSRSLPIVFIITNNQWAISAPRYLQTAAETYAQKGIAAGIRWCEQVDGNDVIAVHYIVSQALLWARTYKVPSVVELLTYRLGDHTTADDAKRYRSLSEVEGARKKEPMARLQKLLESMGVWDQAWREAIERKHDEFIEIEVARYENLRDEPHPPDAMFTHLFATLPAALIEQYEEARRFPQKGAR